MFRCAFTCEYYCTTAETTARSSCSWYQQYQYINNTWNTWADRAKSHDSSYGRSLSLTDRHTRDSAIFVFQWKPSRSNSRQQQTKSYDYEGLWRLMKLTLVDEGIIKQRPSSVTRSLNYIRVQYSVFSVTGSRRSGQTDWLYICVCVCVIYLLTSALYVCRKNNCARKYQPRRHSITFSQTQHPQLGCYTRSDPAQTENAM